MLDSHQRVVAFLGEYGLSAKGIQWNLKQYWSLKVSTSCIYYWLRKAEVSLRDYRNGKTPEVEVIVDEALKQF